MRHVFVQVVRSINDHFSGIRQRISGEGLGSIVDVVFSDEEFEYIKRIEYTDRRFARLFYYPRIFRSLTAKLDAAFADLADEPANVYFTDEGVWALVWADYRRRYPRNQVRGINVQHGFALVRPAPYPRVRRIVNAGARLLSGYPTIGYGSLGGAGADPFDAYLTYDDAAAAHIVEAVGVEAIAAPLIIKHDLLIEFDDLWRERRGPPHAVFAMNIQMRGSPIKCDSVGLYDVMMPFVAELQRRGWSLSFRLHPGLDAASELAQFAAHPISRLATIDDSPSLHHALAGADMVLSLLSTVLWEASLLGLVAVQVKCACCDEIELGYPREIISLEQAFGGRLDELLALSSRQAMDDWRARQDLEWRAVMPLLALGR